MFKFNYDTDFDRFSIISGVITMTFAYLFYKLLTSFKIHILIKLLLIFLLSSLTTMLTTSVMFDIDLHMFNEFFGNALLHNWKPNITHMPFNIVGQISNTFSILIVTLII